ncbi:MAG: AAA family ATPase, partial [Calditrichaeota bacterium]|nr:AAA family ATPase [Calditrichota bacterium]
MKATDKAVSFLPKRIIPWISEGKGERRFEAVVAFADVSGFTKMSEQLATIGHEGAETLTAILNSYFTEMINRIKRDGGFVGKFGGDAMTIFFPVEDTEKSHEVALRAVSTCLDLQQKMVDFQDVKTKAGSFSLGMKIGIALGSVLFRVVGPERDGGKEFLLAGIPLDLAADAEHHGSSGQVIVSTEIASNCNLEDSPVGDGFYLVNPAIKLDPPHFIDRTLSIDSSNLDELTKKFIDPPVYKRIGLGVDSVGEIRRVSIIFMSFSGLDYDLDPQVGDKLEELYGWVQKLIIKFGGSINKVDMGDKGSKMIITFGAPLAHENDEELAVHCGWQLTKGLKKVEKLGVVMRMGISTGVVFAGEVGAPSRQEYTVMGSVVNLSARIMSHSSPGRLIVDDATRTRAKKIFDFSEPEYVQFKGIKEPLPVYEVVGLSSASKKPFQRERRRLTGRDDELKVAKQVLEDVADNKFRVLILKGEAGIGKSRLVREIIRITQEKGFIVGAGEGLSYAKTKPYLTWISILRRLMKLPSAGGGEEALQTIRDIISVADPENEFRLPIVAGILGIECPDNEMTRHFDAQLRQENLFDFIVKLCNYLCNSNQVLLIFEDEQWIDRYSLNLIAHLLRNLPNSPILVIFARRAYSPRFECSHIGEIEGNEAAHTIALAEFSKDVLENLVLRKYHSRGINPDLLNFIYDASHGNIAFTEQLIDNLTALKRIRIVPKPLFEGKPDVRYIEKVGDLSEVEVPDSLTSLIMSQLDRLNEEAKLTVKLAAVIGRQFQSETVTESYPVAMTEENIRLSLTELDSHDIFTSDEDSDIYDYIFKNLLTLDVAYDSLLFAHRREYHKRIGLCLEILQRDSLTEWYEELARHFSNSDDDS